MNNYPLNTKSKTQMIIHIITYLDETNPITNQNDLIRKIQGRSYENFLTIATLDIVADTMQEGLKKALDQCKIGEISNQIKSYDLMVVEPENIEAMIKHNEKVLNKIQRKEAKVKESQKQFKFPERSETTEQRIFQIMDNSWEEITERLQDKVLTTDLRLMKKYIRSYPKPAHSIRF